MIKKIWDLGKREHKKLIENKKALLFLFLVPLVYTMLFGFLYSPHIIQNISTAVINESPSQFTRTITSGFDKSTRFSINHYPENQEAGLALMNNGEIDVLLVIPDGFTEDVKRGKTANVLIGLNGSNSIIGNSATSSAMEIIKTYSAGVSLKTLESGGLTEGEAMAKAAPISSNFRPWFNPQYSYANYLLLGLIAVALQQVLLMSAANSFTREREEGSFNQLLQEGYGIYQIVLGKGLYYLASGMFSLFFAYLVSFTIFKIPLRGDILLLIPMGIFFYIAVIAAGLIIALYSKSQVESIQVSMLFAYPTFLLTGYTWPALAMPDVLVAFGKLFPLTYFAENVRKIALAGADFQILKMDILMLMIIAGIYVAIALFLYRRRLLNEGYKKDRPLESYQPGV